MIKERRKKDTNLTDKQKKEILQIKSYAKNYTGPLKKNNIDKKDYRFYDEREWRLIPGSSILRKAVFSINLNAYEADKDKYNNNIKDCRIKFKAGDISYIIVDKTFEIPEIINYLRNNYADNCTAKELDILFSKICSTEQIIADY